MGMERSTVKRLMAAALSVAVLLGLLCGCSTKKNTALSRNWQAFTTRYNVYFNGSEHYKETLKEMEKSYEDDYTRTVMMHPAEAKANAKLPQPSGDFKRTIEKMQKAIQLHSIKKKPAKKSGSKKEKEFRARDEFNPFLHNAWLMMGRSQFLNGDFTGAASTFFYIGKHFTWLPEVVTEAHLWEAWSYCAMDWIYEAENILQKIDERKLTNNNLRNLYNTVEADLNVRAGRLKEAVPYLQKAAQSSHGTQRNRRYFLLGQIYTRLGEKDKAYMAFRSAGAGASTPYRAKFNARIKQSEVFTGSNIKKEVNSLRAMTRYERNKEFLDQIYYAIGNLYLSRKDSAEAIKNYALAIEKSTRGGIDKALAQLALGGIYFNQGDYVKAQPLYSEAVPQLSDNYPDYKLLKRRSDVLDELSVFAGNVHLQDSLLTLSKMTPEEQTKACQKIVDELKKREKEEEEAAKREAYLADQQAKGDQMNQNSNAPKQYQMNNDKSWYFYNQQAKNTGKTEFQKKWGARKNEDDWRRRNKNTFSFEDVSDNAEETGEEQPELSAEEKAAADSIAAVSDPHNVEYYLAQIPKTEEEIKNCNDIIQEGLYNMGLILKDKLEDIPAARKEFMRLEDRYPDNIYRLDVYYNMYLMAVRQDDTSEAEKWRRKILEDFPESAYGKAMTDPDYFTKLREMHLRQEQMYAETYEAYLNNDNKKVRQMTKTMEEEYPLSHLLPKFVFLDALSYVTSGDTENFKNRLQELLQKWPDTDMTEMASGMLKNLKAGMTIKGGMSNSRGMFWDTRLIADGQDAKTADGQPANFERDPKSPQYLVFAFPRDSINANLLLYNVARFNFSTFTTQDFDLEQMAFGNVGLLIVKGFPNVKAVERYRGTMAQSDMQVIPDGVRPIMISKPNFELLLREGRSFDEYFRYEENAAVEETEKKVIDSGGEGEPGEASEQSGETPAAETAPAPGETPAAEETPKTEEIPAAEETPAAENAPATPQTEAPEAEEEETPSENSEEKAQ